MRTTYTNFIRFILLLLILTSSVDSFAQCNADAGPNITMCLGESEVLGDTPAATGDAPFTYNWSPVTGLSCTNCPNPVCTATSSTIYTLTITDDDGCTDSDNVSVTIAPSPNANFTFSPNNGCSNVPVQFTNTSTGSGLSYAWNFNDPGPGNNSSQTNPTHEFDSNGSGSQSYNVRLIVTNSFGCKDTMFQTVTVAQSPGPELIDPLTSFKNCDGSNFNMTVYDITANPGTNYTIVWGDGSPNYTSPTPPSGGVTHLYTVADIFDMTYIVTGANGCTDSITYLVSNITNPAIGAANPGATTGCGPITLCFPLSNYAANHVSTYYTVNYGDGSPLDTLPHPPPAVICHTYSNSSCGQPGNAFTFTMKAINSCDSSLASISPIRVYTGPQADFVAIPEIQCVNIPVTFTNQSIPGFNSSCSNSTIYNWNFGDGQTLTTITMTNPTHIYTLPGTYTVTLSTQNACGTTTHTETVCIEAPPIPNFVLDPDTACVPFVGVVNNLSITANTCDIDTTWSVIYNGSTCLPSSGAWSYTNGTSATSIEPEFLFSGAGQYTVRLSMNNSCGNFFFDQIVLGQAPPQITMSAIPTICAGESVSPTATINNCYELVDSYSWNFTGGTPINSTLPVPGSVMYPTAGNYSVQLQVANVCGTVNASTPVTVLAPPVANAGPDLSFCSGSNGVLGIAPVGGVSYAWTPASGLSSSTVSNPTVALTNATADPVLHEYVLTASTSPTCFTRDTVDVTVNPIPVLNVNSPVICFGETTSLLVSGAEPSGSYNWTASPELSCTACNNPTTSPSITTTYSVIGTNVYNCSSSINATVIVNPLPIVNAGPDLTLCDQPIAETLTGTPVGGIWTGSVNVTSGGTFTPNGPEISSLAYLYIDPLTSCENSDTMIVTVNSAIIPVIDPIDSLCANLTSVDLVTTLNATPTGGTFVGPGVSGNIINPSLAGIGNHQIIYNLGSGTCASADTAYIRIDPQPIINVNSATICFGDTIALLADGAGVNGTYSWSPTSSLTCSNCPDPFSFAATSTTYTVNGTNAFGCLNSASSTVTVNPLPIVSAGPDLVLCDQPVAETLNGTPAGGTWSGSLNVTSGGIFTPNGSEIAQLIYSYTDAGTGCQQEDTMQVTVSPAVTPTVDPAISICSNDPILNLNTALNPTPLGGAWSGVGITNPNFNAASAGVGTHTVTYTYGSGTCQTFATAEITVNPQPTVIVNSGTICLGDSLALLATGADSYSWSNGATLSCTNCSEPFAEPVTTSSYTVTGTTVLGCSNDAISNVIVNPLPIANAGPDTTLCNLPTNVQFTGTQTGGVWSGPNIDASGVFTPSGTGTFTVTYTVTLGTGCVNSDSRNVTVIDPVPANAGPDEEICIGSSIFNLPMNPAGGNWSGTNVTTTGQFSPIVDGTFPLVYTVGAGNCLTRDTMLFVVHPLPFLDAGNDQDFCETDAVIDFIGTPAGGSWSGVGITNTSNGTFDPVVAGVGLHEIVYTYIDPITTCLNRDTLYADVHPLPVLDFSFNPIVCEGTTETFTNNSTLVNSSSWNFGDGNTSTLLSPDHVYTSTGFYDVELIITTAFGCMDSLTQQIEVREPPVADFSVLPDSACGPMTVAFTNNSSGISVSYTWDFGNGQTSILEDPTAVTYFAGNLADTTYTIQLDVTNFCGTVTHSEDVIVMPTPTAIFGSDFNSGCSPFTANFASTSLGLPDSYYWDFGNGVTSATTDSLFQQTFTTGSTPTDYTIMLIVMNECGQDTAYHTITALPNTVNAFFNTSATTSCFDLTVNFTQYTLGGTLWSWDFGDGTTSSEYSPTHVYPAPGVYNVSLFANDGCSFDTTTVAITVNEPPAIGFDFTPDSSCINVPISFINSAGSDVASTWDFGDGTTSNLTNPIHQYSASGNYTVTLTGTSLINGCQSTISQVINVSQNPVALFTPNPSAGCVELAVQFNNTSTNAQYYTWNFGDGNTSGIANPTHTFNQPGAYNVQIIAENVNGCSDTIQQIVTVHPLPLASFTSTYNCTDPVTIQFSNNSSGAVGYNWDFGNGQTSTLNNPLITYSVPGNYTVSLTAVNQFGCEHEVTQTITIYALPEISFVLPVTEICAGEEIIITPITSDVDSIIWNLGNGETFSGDLLSYTYSSAGNYYISATAYGGSGCISTVSAATVLTVNETAIANFDYEHVETNGGTDGTIAFTNLSQYADSYFWTFGDGNSSNQVNPTHEYIGSVDYTTTLYAYNESGCNDSITINIDINFFNGLFLPNAIYPGHENFEVSHFIPKGVGLKEFELLIYDDWGNLIWETHALDAQGRPTESWDGTFNGQPVQQDSYVWKVTAIFINESTWEGKEYKEGKFRKAGTVTVIR